MHSGMKIILMSKNSYETPYNNKIAAFEAADGRANAHWDHADYLFGRVEYHDDKADDHWDAIVDQFRNFVQIILNELPESRKSAEFGPVTVMLM